ncbi:MAG: type II secretion system F family protein [Candidatus Omnitrophica bacterium]|nr:type II secretion system F family protein [Candidatus Omnitrophota bacterium]
MPTFHYWAKKGPQDTVEGSLEAGSRAGVIAHLAGLGYTPVRITETAASTGQHQRPAARLRPARVPVRQLNQFTRQFASLIRSQVPILRALMILKEQNTHAQLHPILHAIAEGIRQGQTLSEALQKHPKAFSSLYVSLAQTGEVAGILDEVLNRLAAQADREESMRAKINGALAYPVFVAGVGVLTVVFLLTFVMPRLLKLFVGFGGRLPLPTKILIFLSHGMSQAWFWMAAALGVVFVFAIFKARQDQIQSWTDRIVLRLPLAGPLVLQLELARFARSFGLLLDHGVPILRATEIAIPVVRNRVIRQQLARLPAHLREGNTLASGLKGMPMMTPFVMNTIAIGEETGKIGEALIEIASFYELEVERLLDLLSALLEPAMILFVGGIVGFIVMATLLPIFEMSSVIR